MKKNENKRKKRYINHREFIIGQMKIFKSIGLLKFPKGPSVELEKYPDGLSVEDWAYSIATNFVKCCARHFNKSLTEKHFTGNGRNTIFLLDALGHDGDRRRIKNGQKEIQICITQ